MPATADLTGFETVYRRHVSLVQAGDLRGVMADMDPAVVPAVFGGVRTPQGAVSAADIRDARLEGGRAVGECIYTTAEGRIGLRSGWRHDGQTWLADTLENFETTAG